ncbi:MAG: preprotein translocase subunit SecE [Candidatus Moranbacteria bacterium]|nr:preprotein translocase subunit SecE [Candidatus Moranbacteria bacterium]
MQKIIQFLKEAYAELKKVSWPSREQTIHYTILVIVISLTVAIILGLLDNTFSGFLSKFILKN